MNISSQLPNRLLSQIDAFFVAYQERSGILMQLGGEAELRGDIHVVHVMEMLQQLVSRWPQLGQKLSCRLFGLKWSGETRLEEMLYTTNSIDSLTDWRNQPINPFEAPPFQLLWVSEQDRHILAFRAHHAVIDGEAFFDVCIEALSILAKLCGGHSIPLQSKIPQISMLKLLNPMQLLRSGKIQSMISYIRRMGAEANADRSIRLRIRECKPGDTAIWEQRLNNTCLKQFKINAQAHNINPLWLFAAAWARAIHIWNNDESEPSNSFISFEIPVSLRRKYRSYETIGNYISPLTLFGEATLPIIDLARILRRQFVKEIRNRSFLAMPLFSALGRFLPWALFRRVSVSTTSTGFATTHFTWLEQKRDIYSEIEKYSNGRLEMLNQIIYTPVCLQMGVALMVITMSDHLHLFITYRLTALHAEDVNQLASILISELKQIGIEM
ncbi:MAG: hypothetical protein JSW07_13550 [bacterium]|nr:MAG: hypothetical protein JSW07_13550 [bacterium]